MGLSWSPEECCPSSPMLLLSFLFRLSLFFLVDAESAPGARSRYDTKVASLAVKNKCRRCSSRSFQELRCVLATKLEDDEHWLLYDSDNDKTSLVPWLAIEAVERVGGTLQRVANVHVV